LPAKNKTKIFFSEMNEFLNSDKVVIILLILLANNIYGVVGIDIGSYYIDRFQMFLTSPYYLIILLLSILISVFNTLNQFEKNYFFIIRCSGKKEYLNILIKKVCKNVAIIFVMNTIIAMVMMNFAWKGSFGVRIHEWYNITNLQYLIFYFIRMFAIIEVLSVLFVLTIKIFGKRMAWMISVVIILLILFPFRTDIAIESLFSMPLLYTKYLDVYYYDSFALELFCSILFLILSLVILKQLQKLCLKFMNSVGR